MERVFRRGIVRRLFFVFAGLRGNAVRDIPVFWSQRKIPVDLHFIVRLLLRLEDVASVAPSIKVKILHLSTPHVHAGVAAACPCGRTLRSWSDVFPCGTAVRGRWTCVFVLVVPALWHTCVMTVSVSTLLTGLYGRNCLYLN